MRYVLQVSAMLADLLILTAEIVVIYSAIKYHSIFFILVAAAGIWAWHHTGIFYAWRPKNIRNFLANAKKFGL